MRSETLRRIRDISQPFHSVFNGIRNSQKEIEDSFEQGYTDYQELWSESNIAEDYWNIPKERLTLKDIKGILLGNNKKTEAPYKPKRAIKPKKTISEYGRNLKAKITKQNQTMKKMAKERFSEGIEDGTWLVEQTHAIMDNTVSFSDEPVNEYEHAREKALTELQDLIQSIYAEDQQSIIQVNQNSIIEAREREKYNQVYKQAQRDFEQQRAFKERTAQENQRRQEIEQRQAEIERKKQEEAIQREQVKQEQLTQILQELKENEGIFDIDLRPIRRFGHTLANAKDQEILANAIADYQGKKRCYNQQVKEVREALAKILKELEKEDSRQGIFYKVKTEEIQRVLEPYKDLEIAKALPEMALIEDLLQKRINKGAEQEEKIMQDAYSDAEKRAEIEAFIADQSKQTRGQFKEYLRLVDEKAHESPQWKDLQQALHDAWAEYRKAVSVEDRAGKERAQFEQMTALMQKKGYSLEHITSRKFTDRMRVLLKKHPEWQGEFDEINNALKERIGENKGEKIDHIKLKKNGIYTCQYGFCMYKGIKYKDPKSKSSSTSSTNKSKSEVQKQAKPKASTSSTKKYVFVVLKSRLNAVRQAQRVATAVKMTSNYESERMFTLTEAQIPKEISYKVEKNMAYTYNGKQTFFTGKVKEGRFKFRVFEDNGDHEDVYFSVYDFINGNPDIRALGQKSTKHMFSEASNDKLICEKRVDTDAFRVKHTNIDTTGQKRYLTQRGTFIIRDKTTDPKTNKVVYIGVNRLGERMLFTPADLADGRLYQYPVLRSILQYGKWLVLVTGINQETGEIEITELTTFKKKVLGYAQLRQGLLVQPTDTDFNRANNKYKTDKYFAERLDDLNKNAYMVVL